MAIGPAAAAVAAAAEAEAVERLRLFTDTLDETAAGHCGFAEAVVSNLNAELFQEPSQVQDRIPHIADNLLDELARLLDQQEVKPTDQQQLAMPVLTLA